MQMSTYGGTPMTVKISSSHEGQNPVHPSVLVLSAPAKVLCRQRLFAGQTVGAQTAITKRGRTIPMPQNEKTNQKLGFYKSLCCGKEIVVPEGTPLPDCPNHPEAATVWKSILDDNIISFGKRSGYGFVAPRFHVGDQVTFVGVGPHCGLPGGVVEVIDGFLDHIHRYDVCFQDGTSIRCFGFELEPINTEASMSA
jgi:hypothetical protein